MIEGVTNAPKVVSFGGGHGLAATLRALRHVTSQLTAIVTVADNGGSSGRLRSEFDSLPPGDLRMALAALCSDDEWGKNWADLIQYRFTSDGELNGHAIGNLLLAALWDRDGDPIRGLDRVGALLKVVGRVLPMSLEPLDIEATFKNWQGTQVIRGQVQVALARGELRDIRLLPENATSTSEGLASINNADWLTFGPGSWFSSVMPHFLLADQRKAICESQARKILLLNLDANPNSSGDEFAGNSAAEHLRMIRKYAPDFSCEVAVADHSLIHRDEIGVELRGIVGEMGGTLIVADLATIPGSNHHDPRKLAPVFRNIFAREMLR